MSTLLKDRPYVILSESHKLGVWPAHGYKFGLYRIPVSLEDHKEIQQLEQECKRWFDVSRHANRLYLHTSWTETESPRDEGIRGAFRRPRTAGVRPRFEIVYGEAVDLIYDILRPSSLDDTSWLQNYEEKIDFACRQMLDTVLRRTLLGSKLMQHWQAANKLSPEAARQRLEELTPLALAEQAAPTAKPTLPPSTPASKTQPPPSTSAGS